MAASTIRRRFFMTSPKSLLEFAGAPRHPSPLDRSALILIDPQAEYVTGGVPLSGIGAAVEDAVKLLCIAREAAVPVFHIHHHGKQGGALFDPSGPFVRPIPALAPQYGEDVLIKSLPNAFARTDLEDRIRAAGRTELIVAGFATHMCISATVRAALDHGYRTTIVASATATRDLPDPLGGIVPAGEVQRATLAALADRFAIVVRDAGIYASIYAGTRNAEA
jgi:nicotinamidase-related amidase